jgi:hypothetical protein
VDDLAHPFVMGIHWIPLLLFALDRLLESGRTRSAALLAVAGALQALVGAYPLVTTIAFVGAYGVTRMVQLRERLDAGRIVRLALATAAVAGAAATVLVQYAGVGAWGVEQRRQMLVPFQNLLPGAPHAIGGTTLGLAALLLVLRGPRRTPVLPVLAGGLACVLLAGGGRLWPGGPVVSGFYPWLAEHVWIFGIVRVPAAIRTGTHLAVALLAALGTARVLDRLGPRPAARLAIGLALSALLMTEYFQPAASSLVYGTSRAVALVPRRPRGDVLDAYRAFDRHGFDGPVVEIPFDHDGRGPVFRMPAYTLLAAYHGRETPACFTSHVPPSYHEVARMVAGVEASPQRAIVELAAAGLRNVVIHHGDAHALFDAVAHAPGVRPLFRSAAASAFRIVRPVSPHHDAGRLRPGAVSLGNFEFKGYRHAVLELAIRNASARVWALPHPVRPLAVRWRYARADGTPVGEWRDGTTMLPLALAGGATATVRVIVTAPPRGCDDCTPEIRIPALAWRVRGR